MIKLPDERKGKYVSKSSRIPDCYVQVMAVKFRTRQIYCKDLTKNFTLFLCVGDMFILCPVLSPAKL